MVQDDEVRSGTMDNIYHSQFWPAQAPMGFKGNVKQILQICKNVTQMYEIKLSQIYFALKRIVDIVFEYRFF